jgi:hypothetical protein
MKPPMKVIVVIRPILLGEGLDMSGSLLKRILRKLPYVSPKLYLHLKLAPAAECKWDDGHTFQPRLHSLKVSNSFAIATNHLRRHNTTIMKFSFLIPGSFHHAGLVLLGSDFVTSGREDAILASLLKKKKAIFKEGQKPSSSAHRALGTLNRIYGNSPLLLSSLLIWT